MEMLPKSYISDDKRQEMTQGLTQNGIYLVESQAAGNAGDEDTAWEWMRYVKIPAPALKTMKTNLGADFIRRKGLRTETAEAMYGKNWLNE